jgi:hypothetical protein
VQIATVDAAAPPQAIYASPAPAVPSVSQCGALRTLRSVKAISQCTQHCDGQICKTKLGAVRRCGCINGFGQALPRGWPVLVWSMCSAIWCSTRVASHCPARAYARQRAWLNVAVTGELLYVAQCAGHILTTRQAGLSALCSHLAYHCNVYGPISSNINRSARYGMHCSGFAWFHQISPSSSRRCQTCRQTERAVLHGVTPSQAVLTRDFALLQQARACRGARTRSAGG